MKFDTAAAVRAQLANLNLEIKIDGPTPLEDLPPGETVRATVQHPYGAETFTLMYAPTMAVTNLLRHLNDAANPDRLLVIGPRVNERSADTYRRMDINYIDQVGNAFLDFDGVHIDVRGRRPLDSTVPEPARGVRGGTNLFSPKRSQVIFSLLAWPELTAAPLRVLADTANVSIGLAQETLVMLDDAGYLDGGAERALRRTGDLLDRWVVTFPRTLGAPSRQREFFGEIGDIHAPSEISVAISGESAVPELLRPETLTLYVTEFTAKLPSMNRWRTDREPNIFVRKKFWKAPGDIQAETVGRAPSVLIYADLRASAHGRLTEAADWLRTHDDRLQQL